MKQEQILIYGASGFGREVAWLVAACSDRDQKFQACCFVDDDERMQGQVFNEIPVISLSHAKNRFPKCRMISGIGAPNIREETMEKAANEGFRFATMIHPRVEMSQWVDIGEGSIGCAGCILTTNVVLGRHVQMNLSCTVGHDVTIGDFTTLSPGVHVSGCVRIGKRVFIGTGAVIRNGTQEEPLIIGDDSVVGAGACVTKPIPAGETWIGVPARILKKMRK